MRSNAPSRSVGRTSRFSPSLSRSSLKVRNPARVAPLLPAMHVIRRLGILACASAALFAAGPAHAAELPLDGTLDLAEDSDVRLAGEEPGSRAGWVVANAGDFNGDGVDDVLVGAPNSDLAGRV